MVFSCEFCNMFKNIFLTELLRLAISVCYDKKKFFFLVRKIHNFMKKIYFESRFKMK